MVPLPHPLVRCVRGIATVLDRVEGADPVYLTVEEKAEALRGLTYEIARLEGLRAAVLAARMTSLRRRVPGRRVPGWPTPPGWIRPRGGGCSGWPTPWTARTPRPVRRCGQGWCRGSRRR